MQLGLVRKLSIGGGMILIKVKQIMAGILVKLLGNYKANKFGLYDTSGNVWEWTCSEFTSKYKGKEKVCISKNSNKNRVLRGGPRGSYRDCI